MDGNGRYTDNLFIERLWRSLKYEEVYLKAYLDGREVRAGISAHLDFYNTVRPHQTLNYLTPAEVFPASQETSNLAHLAESSGPDPITSGDSAVVGPAFNWALDLSN